MDMGLADFGERMAERGRGEGREGAGDEEGRGTAMAAGEFVEARRTGSFMKRLLKMRESLWGDVVGLCGMGREMSGAEYCNMGSRGRGRRRDQTRPAVSLSGPMFEQRCAEKEKKENRKEKKKKRTEQKNGPTLQTRETHGRAHSHNNIPHATLPFSDTALSCTHGVDPNVDSLEATRGHYSTLSKLYINDSSSKSYQQGPISHPVSQSPPSPSSPHQVKIRP